MPKHESIANDMTVFDRLICLLIVLVIVSTFVGVVSFVSLTITYYITLILFHIDLPVNTTVIYILVVISILRYILPWIWKKIAEVDDSINEHYDNSQ